MSIKIMSWVLDHSPYEGKARLIHAVLADYANDEGTCWPSQATIARRAGCSVEHVRTTVSRMVSDGFLKIIQESGGRGHSTQYQLIPKSVGGFDTRNPQVETRNPQVDGEKPPNPSPKNHQEPSRTDSDTMSQMRCTYCNTRTNGKKHYCGPMNQYI